MSYSIAAESSPERLAKRVKTGVQISSEVVLDIFRGAVDDLEKVMEMAEKFDFPSETLIEIQAATHRLASANNKVSRLLIEKRIKAETEIVVAH